MESPEFGRAVRRWRDRVTPDAVGLPAGRRRRAAGLRREELAGLAGISSDYLTRLEQGRATSPSAQVVEALARSLRLSSAERDLLHQLAGLAAPGRDLVPSHVPPSVHRLLDRLAHTPVAVYDAGMTLVVANGPYDALMGDTSRLTGLERNAIWRNFLGPGSRAALDDEERADLQARMAADLRVTAARYPADPDLRRLVAHLTAHSARFRELWEGGVLAAVPDPSRRKVVVHPVVGPITLDCDTLVDAVDGLRIMIYTAEPETEDADRLALATVVGTQSLVE
ncbi:helix-turn-helix transcriptional regulator [Tersicoccus sp. Bi-70]|uniref:helix-turn-helix transcriptional regulator n=1 Tax=Tersicoccus sp. Bi-70 TaxID=1897634 RepID=UPI000977BE43|nr:helix-turn-helix transcriptional regulator [Tersicoccus sp. Bi-70]OMH34290.1 transcriptional regulator [Tersicoccus sp. Bi-70]